MEGTKKIKRQSTSKWINNQLKKYNQLNTKQPKAMKEQQKTEWKNQQNKNPKNNTKTNNTKNKTWTERTKEGLNEEQQKRARKLTKY